MSEMIFDDNGGLLPQSIKDILSLSYEQAVKLGNDMISREHIFLAILKHKDKKTINILQRLGMNESRVVLDIEDALKKKDNLPVDVNIMLNRSVERLLKLIYLEAKDLKEDTLQPYHLVLAILRDKTCLVSSVLRNDNIDYEIVKNELKKKESNTIKSKFTDDDDYDNDVNDNFENISKVKVDNNSKSNTPVLDNFGTDITKLASEGKLDPIIGRESEIERIAQILSRRKKNNPILIGEPGVGKSTIAEGLAIRIIEKNAPRVLLNKRVLSIDVASIVAGTKYRGQFEERMKAIINELSTVDNIILFIDEIHTIVGAGGPSGQLDAANMLKPALAKGSIQCIGTTTLNEYRQNIEKDGALERRFQKVMVEPTTVEQTIQILLNIKHKYEEHHHVKYTKSAIEACAKLTDRYINDRFLPDKAIDALDEAGSKANITNIKIPDTITRLENKIEKLHQARVKTAKKQEFELAAKYRDEEKVAISALNKEKENWEKSLNIDKVEVDENNVAEVIALMTGIPTQRIKQEEIVRLAKMGDEIRNSVIGQNNAVQQITKAIQRNRSGLKDPNKPIGSFIFLGPTGVGKTQLAKVITKYLFGSEDALIRVDMSEYMEKFAVSRLVGAPPGYVGYEKGGELTEKIRRKPYSVILLDEIEKAHPDVFNILLQMLDEGRLTDSLGRVVSFKNTIIIMTSNIGSRQLQDFGSGVGFSTAKTKEQEIANAKYVIDKALKRSFSPEFINRIDDILMFNPLSKEDIIKIVDIELINLFKRVEALGYKLKISKSAREYIGEIGYSPSFGARPLKRVIQNTIENEISELIIQTKIKVGDTISFNFNAKNKNLTHKIQSTKPKVIKST